MPNNTVSDWSTTPASNTEVGGVDLAENSMRPRDVNNAIRTMMAQIATGIDNSEFGGVTQFTPASAAGPASLDFAEDTDNGTNKIRLTAPSSIASDKTATFQDITGTLYITGGQDVSLADGGTGASLTDPNADRIMFWDDSAGAVTWLAPNTGLAISGTNLNLSFLGLEALTDPNADRVAFWDDSAGAFAWLTMGTGLTITGTTLDSAGGASMTLLGTLTTTSGTTQSLTGIAAGYREIYCELDGVSFSASAALTLALSSTNGAAYGTTQTISNASGSAAAAFSGIVRISNVSSTVADTKTAVSVLATAAGAATSAFNVIIATNTAAVVDAIRFAGGTFDAGSIRIYGVK